MTEYIELQKLTADGVIIKVSGNYAARFIVRRILYRRKFVNITVSRNNHNAAGMLTRCSFNTGAAPYKTVYFSTAYVNISCLKILFNKAVCSFFGYCADSTGSEHVTFTENFFGKLVRHGLIVARKVKVDIRLFSASESKKCFKRNVVSVTYVIFAANRAFFRRKVKSAGNFAVFNKFKVLAFGASIVRRQRVNLSDAGQKRNK